MRSGEEDRLAPPAGTCKSIILLPVAPVCKEDRIIVVGASRGESLNIACRVEADPPAHNFRWKFNNSGETLEVEQARFSMEKSSGVSVLKYTPSTELDYGTLSCWADNLVGTQSRPCLFQLVAAGEYIHNKLQRGCLEGLYESKYCNFLRKKLIKRSVLTL